MNAPNFIKIIKALRTEVPNLDIESESKIISHLSKVEQIITKNELNKTLVLTPEEISFVRAGRKIKAIMSYGRRTGWSMDVCRKKIDQCRL